MYLRKEIQKAMGINPEKDSKEKLDNSLEVIANKRMFFVVPKGASPEEVLSSIEIIRKQVEHEKEE